MSLERFQVIYLSRHEQQPSKHGKVIYFL